MAKNRNRVGERTVKSVIKYSAVSIAACSTLFAITGCSSSSQTTSPHTTSSTASSSSKTSSASAPVEAANYQRVTSYSGGYSFEIPSSWIYADEKTDLNTTAGLNQLKKVEKTGGVKPSDMASDLTEFKNYRSLYATATTKRGAAADAIIIEKRDDLGSLPSLADIKKSYTKNPGVLTGETTVKTSLGEVDEVQTKSAYQGVKFQNVLLYVLAPKSHKVQMIGISTTDRQPTTDLTKHVMDSLQPAG